MDDESVKFVEEFGIAGEVGLEERANLFVGAARIRLDFGWKKIVAFEDAARVGVDYEYWMLTGVENDGVGGFGADSADRQELNAQNCDGSGEEVVQRAEVILVEKGDE